MFNEAWGLVEHTEDVCKRVSKLGFAAVTPNLYKGHGFFSKARKEVYDRDAANEAWDITVWFLKRTLGRH